ncbi:MAG: hypothetical protein KGJ07_00150 [Patescibacteria group bacterium]|nr:hypothetical protein [Patescibacteria group bacterium]
MNEYKCHKHRINFACLGCVKAWIARHDAMLKFIKELSDADVKSADNMEICDVALHARELLRKIGK